MFPRQRGVALIITLIMIAVITFMAVTFLAVSRREQGQVTTTLDQTAARLAADSARERALAEMLATVLATTNAFNFDLLVSTNLINWGGFDPAAVDWRTNVNYFYQNDAGHTPLTAALALANLTNLLFNPSPPVFITNKFKGGMEFRFYLDLNRDGLYTTNGLWPVINPKGGYYDTNGNEITAIIPGNTLSNYFTGDPEFLGMLQRAEFPHSPSNKFVARYAFIVLPAGKTLDVNYNHNHAKPTPPDQDGFYRNQGVGSWEINLAAFLADLNTNIWGLSHYTYETNPAVQSGQLAFQDAASLTKFRYGYDYGQLYSVQALYGGPNGRGDLAFRSDAIDGYSAGPLMTGLYPPVIDPDVALGVRTATPWAGADNTNHFFTPQDFFDRSKTAYPGNTLPFLPLTFPDRLWSAGTNASSYDRYTYYRMLAQLGTDSAPEPPAKLNLNYANIGGLSATNFVAWTNTLYGRPGSEVFFTNAVDRLLKQYSKDWRDRDATNGFSFYTNTFGSTNLMSAGSIPVFVNGRFAYTPAVHRLLQLAANMYDAINPAYFPGTAYPMPTVFRPQFTNVGANVYIRDFVEVTPANPPDFTKLVDLGFTNAVTSVKLDSLIFGVPLVVGARQGLPNFNEFSTESVFQITRKLELVKRGPGDGSLIYQTNQMFTIGISNVFGAEFWNSYTNNYPRPVDIQVTNFITLSLTNDYNYRTNSNLIAFGRVITNSWPGWSGQQADASFIVPLRSNHIILPVSVYRQAQNQFVALTESFERPSGFAFPRWGLAITNKVLAVIRDRVTQRIVDYVQLSGMASFRDLTGEMAQPRTALYFDGLWATNSPDGILLSDQPGIIQQIEISKGSDGQDGRGDWRSYGFNQPADATKAQEIANFQAFFTPDHTALYTDKKSGHTFSGSNYATTANAPFTPTWKQSLPFVWQANDPLVHYTTGDMEDLDVSGLLQLWSPPGSTNMPTIANVGRLNDRYRPWGGNPWQTAGGTSTKTDPNAFKTVLKDPGVWSSEDWQFPTNKLPTLGWLGRIHRGSPWQTIYLKSATLAAGAATGADWQKWAGNRFAYDATNTIPESDRGLFDLFTTAFNDNAARGQLPINQSGLAAWSAVFGGLLALANTTPDADLLYDVPPQFDPLIIEPAGVYDPVNSNTWPAVVKIVNGLGGINRTRTNLNLFPQKTFSRLGDILAVPALTTTSPFLNQSTALQRQSGMNDAVYEWLPQQLLSLVRLGEPRFVVYAYGQALKPTDRSIQVSGPYFGLCTNYQITAEVVTRSVVKVIGSPDPAQTNNADPNLNYPPRLVVESFNVLPPE